MAFDILTIPGMSAECERIFSQAKLLVTDSHSSLAPHTVQAYETQKQWLCCKLVTTTSTGGLKQICTTLDDSGG